MIIRFVSSVVLMTVVTLMAFTSCASGPSAPPEIKQSFSAVRFMLKPNRLSRSGFKLSYPEAKPSQFVSYLFSDMGADIWPASSFEAEEAASIGEPILPDDVTLEPLDRDAQQKKQVVIKGDDEKWVLILEGYTDPTLPPVATEELKFPKL